MDFISWEATSETLHDALHRIMILVLVALISLFIFKRLPTSEVEVEKETEIEAEVIEPKYEQEDLSEAADEVDGSVENTQEKMEVFITSEENVYSTAEIVIIEDEMQKELRKCTCAVPLRMHRLGGGKYKVTVFEIFFLRNTNVYNNFLPCRFPIQIELVW